MGIVFNRIEKKKKQNDLKLLLYSNIIVNNSNIFCLITKIFTYSIESVRFLNFLNTQLNFPQKMLTLRKCKVASPTD